MNEGIDAWLEEGLRFYSQGDPSRALEAWYRILEKEPGHSLAQQYVAYVRQVYRLDAPPTPPGAPAPSSSAVVGPRSDVPPSSQAPRTEETPSAAMPRSGHQGTNVLDKKMSSPAHPAAETLPPVAVDERKSLANLDPSSAWSDVVDSAFDVTTPPPPGIPVGALAAAGALGAAGRPAAKMAASNPWAPTKPPSSPGMPAVNPPSSSSSSSSSAQPSAVARVKDPASQSQSMLSAIMPSPEEEASWGQSQANANAAALAAAPGEDAITKAQRLRTLEPLQTPSLEPIAPSSLQPVTSPAIAQPPAAERDGFTVPSQTPPPPAQMRRSEFDPWAGDTIPPVRVPTPDLKVDIEMPPATPPPVSVKELLIAAASAAEETTTPDGDSFDINVDDDSSRPAPSPSSSPANAMGAMSAASDAFDVDLVDEQPAEKPKFNLTPSPAPAPSAPAAAKKDDEWSGVHRAAPSSRVEVAPSASFATAPRGPVEEKASKPSRRFDGFGDTPSRPMSPSPPVASAASSNASHAASSHVASSSAASSSAASSKAVSSSAASSNGPALSSLGASPIPTPMPSMTIQIDDDQTEQGPGVVVDPWDEVGGPGGALDLDKVQVTTSPFEELLGTANNATVEPWPSPQPEEAPEDQCSSLMKGAKELFDLGDFSGSLELVEKVLTIDAENDSAKAYLKRNESTLVRMYESKLGDMRKQPRQLMPPDEVIWMNMHHKAGFILSQVDGSLSYEDILEVSGMPRFDAMRILADLVQQGIIG